ncbi:MAG: HAD family hydrolase [Aestuariivirga sp.]
MWNETPRALVFDLDDTLYLERDFAESGFKAAGDWLRSETGVDGLHAICTRLFAQGNRANIFDDALRELAPQKPHALVERLVDVYRHHLPEIALADDAKRCLERHIGRISLGLITDGLAETQWAKIRSLNIEPFFDCIVCTGDWGRKYWKPHPRSYEFMEQRFMAEGRDMIYVADNPAKDFVTAKARGWRTVQLARPGRIHTMSAAEQSHNAHETIKSLDDFEAFKSITVRDH